MTDEATKIALPADVTEAAQTVMRPADPVVEQSPSNALMIMIERAAFSPNFDVAKLEKMLDVKERWDAAEAYKAYIAAKAAFKGECPTITKNKQVGFESKRGGADTSYRHATLDHIETTVSPILSKHGLTYAWKTIQGEGGRITVTCTLTHVMGHKEEVALAASPDTTGNKNNIQAVGSTVTYLSRYTLLAILGLSTGEDDDGMAAGQGDDKTCYISVFEKEELVGLIKETKTDTKTFLRTMELGPSLDEIPLTLFAKAKNALLAKKQKQQAQGGQK